MPRDDKLMRACEAISLSFPCERSAVFYVIARNEAISLFRSSPPFGVASASLVIASVAWQSLFSCQRPLLGLRAQRGFLCHCERSAENIVIASLRSNLSFVCSPAPNNRDRHVPRDDRSICHCEPAKQSLFYLFAGCVKARLLRSSR